MPTRRRANIGRRTRQSVRQDRYALHMNGNQAVSENAIFHRKFIDELRSLFYITCTKCKKTELKSQEANYICYQCRRKSDKFTAANNMDPGPVPEELKDLSMCEQMLIARVQPVLRVYHVNACGRQGQWRYRGHVINVEQDISELASRLPRLPENVNIIIVKRQGLTNYPELTVRRSKVLNALRWLKANNRFYADIVIDGSAASQLPIDGNVYDRVSYLNDYDNGSEINEKFDDDCVTETAVSHVPIQRQATTISNVINFPEWSPITINEFVTPGYIVQAFPHLFLTGAADFHDNTRPTNRQPTLKEWIKYLMHHKEMRFQRDPRFRFFCLNTMQRHDAISTAAVFAKKSDFTGTIRQLEVAINNDRLLLKKLLAYGQNIRGSSSFWYQKRLQLQAMVNHLKIPTLFLTLSAADLWWPDMLRLFGVKPSDFENEIIQARDMQKLLNDNPQIANEYFCRRVDAFFKIIKKKFNIIDWFYRFEWQHRGSPHVHAVLWLADAPDVLTFDTATPDQLASCKTYYDSLICAWHPAQQTPPATQHPCSKDCTEVSIDDPVATAELLNRVQRHTRHTKHCQRTVCRNETVCRFGFPKQVQQESTLAKNDRGIWEYKPARNDELLDEHNSFVAHAWRANTDCKIVASEHAIINYISKYATKGEPQSQDFKEIFQAILSSLPDNTRPRTAFSKLLNKVVGQRDISACEIHHLLSGEDLYSFSRQFVKLYIADEEYVAITNIVQPRTSLLEKYMMRGETYENLTLHEFASWYTIRGRQLKRLNKQQIVQVMPSLTPENDIYYKQKLSLHIPFRNYDELKTHATWKETFEARNLLFWELTGEADPVEPEPEFEEPEAPQYDWTAYAAALPGADRLRAQPGDRDLDRHYDWYSTINKYPGIEQQVNFVSVSKQSTIINANQSSDGFALNTEQAVIIEHLQRQLNGDTNSKLSIVSGSAGTGKSCVIREIIEQVKTRFGDNSILLLAPTGVAANNIGGQTIHSALKIPCNGSQALLSNERFRDFQVTMESVKVICIDEMSMIGQRMLGLIDARLKQANPEYQDEVFGGYIVYLFGDFNQIQPVFDPPMFTTKTTSLQGKNAYAGFNKVFFLRTIMRQIGDEQVQFKNVLTNIAEGRVCSEDYNLLKTRFWSNNYDRHNEFHNALRIMTTYESIDPYNEEELRKLNNPVVIIKAQHNNDTAKSATPEECQGLTNELRICAGARVMLRSNLWTDGGLCNGSLGTVVDVIYKQSSAQDAREDFPICVLIKFDDSYKGPTLYNGLVPIAPMTVGFKKGNVSCTRKQFPLCVAFAISAHRSQGITVDKAVVYIGRSEFSLGLSYVALSRVRTIEGLLLYEFPETRLLGINSSRQ